MKELKAFFKKDPFNLLVFILSIIILLIGTLVVNFLVGWQWVLSHYVQDKMFYIDPVTNMETPLNIYKSNIICFGVSNMLLSILAFFIISCIIKWRSKNCPYSPF